MRGTFQRRQIPDAVSGHTVEMLYMKAGRMEVWAVPGRCMDLYEARFDDVNVSLTDRNAAIIDPDYVCRGAESFRRSFFAGMLTTCGLIQTGRPCEENGRFFGLHGSVSHLPAASWKAEETEEGIALKVSVEERHQEGEHLQLEREYCLWDGGISWRDRVTNLGVSTPFMLMYHINFGMPFVSENLKVKTTFLYEEDRGTGKPAGMETILKMAAPEPGRPENVYYTRTKDRQITLISEETGLCAELVYAGLDWLGVWKNYTPDKYGLGLEPCVCPSLGRVGARKRGLLPILAKGETHVSGARLCFKRIKETEV